MLLTPLYSYDSYIFNILPMSNGHPVDASGHEYSTAIFTINGYIIRTPLLFYPHLQKSFPHQVHHQTKRWREPFGHNLEHRKITILKNCPLNLFVHFGRNWFIFMFFLLKKSIFLYVFLYYFNLLMLKSILKNNRYDNIKQASKPI